MIEQTWWQRFRAWLAYLIFPEPSNWYVEACERADKLEAKNEVLRKAYKKIQDADGPDLKLPIAMTLAMAEMTSLLKDSE